MNTAKRNVVRGVVLGILVLAIFPARSWWRKAHVEWAIAALSDSNERVRSYARFDLKEYGTPSVVVPRLLALLESSEANTRIGAAETIGLYEADSDRVLPAIRKALRDPDARVRVEALVSDHWLWQQRGEDPTPDIISFTKDPDALVRSTALHLLRGARDPARAVSALITALKDGNPQVRGSAAEGLGMLGPDAKGAVGELKAATADPDAEVQEAAKGALRQLETREQADRESSGSPR